MHMVDASGQRQCHDRMRMVNEMKYSEAERKAIMAEARKNIERKFSAAPLQYAVHDGEDALEAHAALMPSRSRRSPNAALIPVQKIGCVLCLMLGSSSVWITR